MAEPESSVKRTINLMGTQNLLSSSYLSSSFLSFSFSMHMTSQGRLFPTPELKVPHFQRLARTDQHQWFHDYERANMSGEGWVSYQPVVQSAMTGSGVTWKPGYQAPPPGCAQQFSDRRSQASSVPRRVNEVPRVSR